MVESLCCDSKRSSVGGARVVMATIREGSVWMQDSVAFLWASTGDSFLSQIWLILDIVSAFA